ncbi:MAG: SDR family oxidoreductase [Polyangiaceae bacterium]
MGETALITGASAGIGRELAQIFAREKTNLVLVARRRDRLESLSQELMAEHGIAALVVDEDLADPASPARVVEAVGREGWVIDFLVNNAGFGTNGSFAELDLERELAQIQVNVTSLVHMTRLVLPQMLARGRGRILNIGSTAGFQPGPFMAVYYASKAFVNHFTEALWYELKGTGVTATVSCPGATATEFAGIAGNDKSKLFQMGAASPAHIAREAHRAMMQGKPMVVHGLKNKIGLQSLRISPRAAVRNLAATLNKE